MVNIPLFTGFYTSQLVQDFFHQQYRKSATSNQIHTINHGTLRFFQVIVRHPLCHQFFFKQLLKNGGWKMILPSFLGWLEFPNLQQKGAKSLTETSLLLWEVSCFLDKNPAWNHVDIATIPWYHASCLFPCLRYLVCDVCSFNR